MADLSADDPSADDLSDDDSSGGDISADEFIQLVHRSQLVAKDQLADAIAELRKNGGSVDATAIANCLEKNGLLTEWQRKNLLLGKSRGFVLADYRLLDHLGTGGMSSVFIASHRLIDRRVAIKILPASKVGDNSLLDRFQREAQATARLSHPNIVRVFDIDEHDGTHFMVMELVTGRDLRAIVKQKGPLSLEKAAHYIAQAATGLQHAHERGLVHRDIKPANLVVNDDDVLKVLDLGLARVEDDDELASLTVANAETMMGTADYLAPEQALNAHAVDHRADIYSLGCTLYYLLTAHPPFTTGTIAQRILMHQNEQPRDVRAEREDCPHAIADVCMKMLAKNPVDRIQSGAEVASRLCRWLISNGFGTEGATYRVADDALSIPIVTREVEGAAPVGDSQTLLESRKSRSTRSVKAPIALWVFLAVAILVCLALLIFVLIR